MKKLYWFYIEPYVQLSANGDQAVVYNAINGILKEYDNPKIVDLIKELKSKENLLVVGLSADQLADPDVSAFIEEVREFYSGDLIDASYSGRKPLQMMPWAKIQKDVTEKRSLVESDIGESIMEYLTDITLYINSFCRQDCSFCKQGYKQFLVCCKGDGGAPEELEIEKIKQLIKEAEGSSLYRINISGGNIFTYSKFTDLVRLLNNMLKIKTYQAHYLNLIDRGEELKLMKNDESYLNVFIDFPVKEEQLEKVVQICAGAGLNSEFHFVLQEEDEIETARGIASRLKIDDAALKPFYNRENFDFFKNNVFTDKEEIRQEKPGLKEIFSRTKTNPLHFGKITVLSNGAIHGNVNTGKIGHLGKDTIYDVVLKEMHDGSSWINPRVGVTPCKTCNYALLCPPISNYEYALERNNLCHIQVN